MNRKIISILSTLIISFALSNKVMADPMGDVLADTVCVYFNFSGSPTFNVILDEDITQEGIAEEGYDFEQHGKLHYYWGKTDLISSKGDFVAECTVYKLDNETLYTKFKVIAKKIPTIRDNHFRFTKIR